MNPFARMSIRTGATLLALLAACTTVTAQTPPPLELPNLDLVDDGTVSTIVRQPDGGVVFCGEFSSIGDVPRKNIARLLPGGALDPDWNPGLASGLCLLAVDDDGAVYVGGDFISIAGVNRPYLAKLTGSGNAVVDENWQPDISQPIRSLDIAGGDVFVQGEFFDPDTGSFEGLAKLSLATGARDPAWHVAVDRRVISVEVIGNSVYIAGYFISIGGLPRNGLARADRGGNGAVDPGWDPSPNGFGAQVLLSDGAGYLYVGGPFGEIAGRSRSGIARFSTATGEIDETWKPSVPFGGSQSVTSLAFDGDRLYAGGTFVGASMSSLSRVTLISTSGAGAFDFNWVDVRDGDVSAVALNGSSLVVGGSFTRVSGRTQAALARLDAGGALSAAQVDIGVPGQVLAIAR